MSSREPTTEQLFACRLAWLLLGPKIYAKLKLPWANIISKPLQDVKGWPTRPPTRPPTPTPIQPPIPPETPEPTPTPRPVPVAPVPYIPPPYIPPPTYVMPWDPGPPHRPSTTPPKRGEWADCTDDTYWRCNAYCTNWDGEKWKEAGPGMSLLVALGATWPAGYYPIKVRVSFTTGSGKLDLLSVGKTAGGWDYGAQANYVSGDEVELLCTGAIERINLYGPAMDAEVTKIEFYTET